MAKEKIAIAIVGPGRSGKDEVAQALDGKGPFKWCGSLSWYALPFISRALGVTEQACWDNRHKHRGLWYEFCNWLRREDPCFLIRRALKKGNVVSGIRDVVEIDRAIEDQLFDAILWVERPETPVDPTLTYGKEKATDVLHNTGSLDDLRAAARAWAARKGFLA
jgi:hypothetical protein